jgi:hypothetical protein
MAEPSTRRPAAGAAAAVGVSAGGAAAGRGGRIGAENGVGHAVMISPVRGRAD